MVHKFRIVHYENTPIQIFKNWKFSDKKKQKKKKKKNDIFHISVQSIDCEYSFEPPRWGGSNEYPHCIFFSRKKKKK